MDNELTASMDPYLDYLKARIAKVEHKGQWDDLPAARAEYNRALDFARNNDMTQRYALDATKKDES